LQHRKKYHGLDSSLPTVGTKIGTHTAEVLRQVEGAKVPRGGWVGGDAWFGSVMTAVEVFVRLGVYSTFILKNNNALFPNRALLAVLVARFGDRPAGHWVVFRATIGGAKLFAMVYAWSQKGVSYFVSTCGRTDPHPIKYQSNFENDVGAVSYKEIDRPWIAHFLYDYLPLIDEHNKQRQSLLHLERIWQTRDCWFRMVTTLLGMSIVDMHRCFRNHNYRKKVAELGDAIAENGGDVPDRDDEDDMKIKEFADCIAGWLVKIEERVRASPRKRTPDHSDDLERIQLEGKIAREPTLVQKARGRTVGDSYVHKCLVCRMFQTKNDLPTYVDTSWRCKDCHMPLCKVDRMSSDTRRKYSCVGYHLCNPGDVDAEAALMCRRAVTGRAFQCPKSIYIEFIHPRRSSRRRGSS
jgi:hypothetical protein